MTIRNQFIAAFAASGLTRAALSRASGVARDKISKYLSGDCDLNTATVDRLMAAICSASVAATKCEQAIALPG